MEGRIFADQYTVLEPRQRVNEHEAQVAVNKARALLLRHNIETVDLRGERRFGIRWLGPPGPEL